MKRTAALAFMLLLGPAYSADNPNCDPSSGLALDASCLALQRIPSVKNTKADPFQLCTALGKRLPPRLPDIKRLAEIQKETVRSELGEFCREGKCRLHRIAFSGLELYLAVDRKTEEAMVLTLRVSGSRWKVLDPVRVNGKLSEAENYFGVKVPANTSPIRVYGDCSYVDIRHRAGRITDAFLDCQVCI